MANVTINIEDTCTDKLTLQNGDLILVKAASCSGTSAYMVSTFGSECGACWESAHPFLDKYRPFNSKEHCALVSMSSGLRVNSKPLPRTTDFQTLKQYIGEYNATPSMIKHIKKDEYHITIGRVCK